jgi:hypothetical protein
MGDNLVPKTWVTPSGLRGLQGSLLQVDVAETIGHRADEPNAVVGFPDTEPLPGEAGDADFVRGRKR